MRDFDRLLTLVCKGGEDGSITVSTWLILECSINGILGKTFDCVGLQVGGSGTILGVLVTSNTTAGLALPSGTLEKVVFPAFVISNLDVGLEKAIYPRTPRLPKAL